MRASLATILALGALGSSCVENDGSVFIEGVIPVNQEGECVAKADSKVFQAAGVLDLAANTGYSAALQVRTNLPSTFSGVDVSDARTKSPNYPAYGNIDNNVLIIDDAEVSFSFTTDPVTRQKLLEAVDEIEPAFTGELSCDDKTNECTLGTRTAVASGSVFNVQTSLNQSQAIFTEAIPSSLASELARLYRAAAVGAGVDPAGNTDNNVADEPNLLQVPALRQQMKVSISLNGTTTGGAKVSSFVFPFPIELCLGCLAPDQSFCSDFGAVALNVPPDDVQACFVGVDSPTSQCVCTDDSNVVTGVVNRDRSVCSSAP